jgi:hypothetical protein
MPLKHREFLKYLETVACVREYILDGLLSHGITLDTPSDSKVPSPQESHRSHLGGSSGNCCQAPSCPNAPVLSGATLKALRETKVNLYVIEIIICAGRHDTEKRSDHQNRSYQVWIDLRDAYNSCIDNLQVLTLILH